MQTCFRLAVLWGAGFAALTLIDLFWLGVVAAPVYQSEIGSLLASSKEAGAGRIAAALFTWLLITLGIVCFVLPKAPQEAGRAAGFMAVIGWGALLGFIVYGVYDLTNLAVLRGWTAKVVLLDIAWGTFVCALISAFTHGLDRWFFGRA